MSKNQNTYIENIEKIKSLIAEIESNHGDKKTILKKFKQAVELLGECENKIKDTKKSIISIVDLNEK